MAKRQSNIIALEGMIDSIRPHSFRQGIDVLTIIGDKLDLTIPISRNIGAKRGMKIRKFLKEKDTD
jgi:hypothetical protein